MFLPDQENLYALLPGIPASFEGRIPHDNWSCLYYDGRSTALRKTGLRFERSGPQALAPWQAIFPAGPLDREAVFCVASLTGQPAATTSFSHTYSRGNPGNVTLELKDNGKKFGIGKRQLDPDGSLAAGMVMAVAIEDTAMVLDTALDIRLVWAGDLNADGHPDIVVRSSNREDCIETQLHLSHPGKRFHLRKYSGFYACGEPKVPFLRHTLSLAPKHLRLPKDKAE